MDCDWSEPGRAPYTGSARAAIMAFATIPAPIRQVLAERAERGDFDDVVMIDRDSITSHNGRHAYRPEMRSMHFGGKGKVCDTITRKWKSSHVESAMVFCEGAYCVARPSVCNNYSLITRLPDRKAEAVGSASEAGDAGGSTVAAAVPMLAAPVDGILASAGGTGGTGSTFVGGGGGSFYVGGGGSACCVAPPVTTPPVTPIPEPATWALLIAGIAAGAYRVRNK